MSPHAVTSHQARLPKLSPTAVATALTVCMAAWPMVVQAQSYSARLLSNPSSAKSCTMREARLSAAGDVSANCFFPRVTLAGIFVAINGGLAGQTTSKAVVWRGTATSATTLSGSLTQPRSYSLGMLPDSSVLGYIGSNSNDDYKAATLSQWHCHHLATTAPGLRHRQARLSNTKLARQRQRPSGLAFRARPELHPTL